MNYTFRDVTLSAEEFFELKQCVGEFRRICRDSVYRYVKGEYLSSSDSVGLNRFRISEALVLFLDEVERLNKTVE